jgi:SNF2 family DNA or RNA helicase
MAKYSVKDLAKIIQTGQLGLSQDRATLLYKPFDPNDKRVEYLVETSGWSHVRGVANVLQAAATLENYYFLKESELKFIPTSRVESWFFTVQDSPTSFEVAVAKELQNSALFDYQQKAAEFLWFRERAMLSLSPGLGKTLTSAFAAGLKGFYRVLVVCPASLLFYWKGELEKWADRLPDKPTKIAIWHRKTMIDEIEYRPLGQEWIITNPETVAKHIDSFTGNSQWFDCLIVDESIMYKHRESQRSKAMKELAKSIKTVWMLTGAPATKTLDDMWHQFHILKPAGYPSYWRFSRKYCLVLDDDWGSKVVANAPKGEEEIKKNFRDIYFSRTQDDVADIPDWIMEDIDIPMRPKQNEAYQVLREELYVRLESIDPNQVITVNNHLSLMIRSVQVASNPLLVGGVDSAGKWDALPELMEIYPGPYLVWVNFIATGTMLRDKLSNLGKRVALANGSTPMEERNQMVDAFQGGEIDALILNNQVGKFGFTLTKARTAFFVERMYDDSYFQCLHRNRRIGTEFSPIVVNMRSVTAAGEQTIDHLIHSVLDYRNGMIRKVTAGDLKKIFKK